MKNIVILISGDGSNMDAIIRVAKAQKWEKQLHVKVVAAISNRPSAKGLDLFFHSGYFGNFHRTSYDKIHNIVYSCIG